ncbi:MAG: hypothetical protein CW716_09420 [Candidatus Bathyarchaeum sp.]|nr:MAG: hypothetical protein CW716_09420 [Candidatus Bathyarchaeum sp.]
MEDRSGEGHIRGSSKAVFAGAHKKKLQKLKLAKCMKCGRLNPFRPESKGIKYTAIRCKYCGNIISFGVNGKESSVSKRAEIFCEKCEDDCRQCPINKLTNEHTFSRKRHMK